MRVQIEDLSELDTLNSLGGDVQTEAVCPAAGCGLKKKGKSFKRNQMRCRKVRSWKELGL